ncbi:MAG TPA: helix-turn-helix transcriptional regulator [Vicinamibacteria bacterium]|nr:helix-turn-helix transcriptional regulator [Vicinamibacteria bacterium]
MGLDSNASQYLVLLGMKGEALKGHLDLLLLAVIQRGPLHGYGVVERLRDHSGDAFALAEGTIYPALHRLESSGVLTSRWSEIEGRRRRVYELTARGILELARRREEWGAFSRAVSQVLEPA